jgi:hypothetical protein
VGPLELARGSLVFVPAVDFSRGPWRVGEVTCVNRVGSRLVSVRPLGCKNDNTYDLSQLRAPGVDLSWGQGCRNPRS